MSNFIKKDRLKKRCNRYNNHHREFGNMPSQDIDMMIYDKQDNTVCMLETKHFLSKGPSLNLKNQQHNKNSKMANKLDIPYFVVYYVPDKSEPNVELYDNGDFWEYRVFPRNELALNYLPKEGKIMSDFEYCQFLYNVTKVTEKPNQLLSNDKTDDLDNLDVNFNW